MGGTGNKSEPPKKTDDKSKKPAPAPVVETDDDEDGDIATPKRDRSGNDDQMLGRRLRRLVRRAGIAGYVDGEI